MSSREKEDGKGGGAGSRAGVWVRAGREKARCSGTVIFFGCSGTVIFLEHFFFQSGAYQSCAPTPPWRVEEANLLFDAQQANKDLPLNVVARSAPVATSVIYSSSFSNIFTRRASYMQRRPRPIARRGHVPSGWSEDTRSCQLFGTAARTAACCCVWHHTILVLSTIFLTVLGKIWAVYKHKTFFVSLMVKQITNNRLDPETKTGASTPRAP